MVDWLMSTRPSLKTPPPNPPFPVSFPEIVQAMTLLIGDVDWRAAGLLLVGSVAGAWLGAWVADRVDERILAISFAAVLTIAGVRMLF